MVTSVLVYDATHANIGQLPKGVQVAGYTTGTADIQWTAQDWAAHPDTARIDQDPAASRPRPPTSWTSRREPPPRPARPIG